MPTTAWLYGSVIALVVGAAATVYLWLLRRRRDERAAGLQALAGMRWRDFSALVLQAMRRRGYQRVAADHDQARERGASFLLDGDGRQLLLACKHGSAYRIGAVAVEELASEVRLRGAQGGILVTEGILSQDGRDKAIRHHIEVLDGTRLWPETKPLIDDALRRRIVGEAATRARRHTGIAWLGAATAGLAVTLLLPDAPDPAAGIAPVAAPAARPSTAPAAIPPSPAPAAIDAPSGEEQLERERQAVSRALAGIDGLARGIWISRSTLAVDRKAAEAKAWPLVCGELARHPDLALTRVQMNPPPGSGEPVRWRQCEAMQR